MQNPRSSINRSTDDLTKSSSSPETSYRDSLSRSSLPRSGRLRNEFIVKPLGCLADLRLQSGGPLDVINLLDVAQQETDLPYISLKHDLIFSISTYGIKLMDRNTRLATFRIPMSTIERVVSYDDGLTNRSIVAVKTVDKCNGSDQKYTIHAFQCEDKTSAMKICKTFHGELESIITMIKSSAE